MKVSLILIAALLPLTLSNNTYRRSYQTTTSNWQTILTALQQNPALLLQLRNNPNLLQSIQSGLLQKQEKKEDQCAKLKKENARLKQMIRAFLEGSDPEIGFLDEDSGYLNQALGRRSQRELNTAKVLLNQAIQKPSISIQRVLVTPTATWTTRTETSSYLTTLTTEASTEVPIILRGSKFITTIVEPTTVTGYSHMYRI